MADFNFGGGAAWRRKIYLFWAPPPPPGGGGGSVEQYEVAQYTFVGDGTAISTKVVVPETHEVRSFTTAIESSTIMAGSGDIRDISDPPGGLIQNADAQTVLDAIQYKSWNISPHRTHKLTHDYNGNMFFRDGHEIIMINTTDNTKTTWTLPEGWGGWSDRR